MVTASSWQCVAVLDDYPIQRSRVELSAVQVEFGTSHRTCGAVRCRRWAATTPRNKSGFRNILLLDPLSVAVKPIDLVSRY